MNKKDSMENKNEENCINYQSSEKKNPLENGMGKQYEELEALTEELLEKVNPVLELRMLSGEVDRDSSYTNMSRLQKELVDFKGSLIGVSEKEKKEKTGEFVSTKKIEITIIEKKVSSLLRIHKKFNGLKKELIDSMLIHDGEYALLSELLGDPENYNSPEELKTAIDSGEIDSWWDELNPMEKYFEKIDYRILEGAIQCSKKSINKLKDSIADEGYEQFLSKKYLDRYGPPDPIDMKVFYKYKEKIDQGEINIEKAEELLLLQEIIEKQAETLFDKNPERSLNGDNIYHQAFSKYEKIINETKDISKKRIIKLFEGKRELSDDEINETIERITTSAEKYLERVIESPISDDISTKDIEEMMTHFDIKISLLEKVLLNLSHDEIANIDLRDIAEIERIEDLKSSDLIKNDELFGKVSSLIGELFPPGAKESFEEECHNKSLEFTITMVKGGVISAYSRERMDTGVISLDWFVSNPKAAIKGLAEATSKLEFYNKGTEEEEYYVAAKPHVKSFLILIEKMGFVSFAGSTEDGEQKHHYARCRMTSDDKKLMTKNLSTSEEDKLINVLKARTNKERKIETMILNGDRLKFAIVNYDGLNHEDDITKESEEGWLYSELENQARDNYVLTRYIPVSTDKNNNSFYVVFEKSVKDKEEELEFYKKVVDKKYQREDEDESQIA